MIIEHNEQELVLQQGGSSWEFYLQFPNNPDEYIADCEEHSYTAVRCGNVEIVTIDGIDYVRLHSLCDVVDNVLTTAREILI